MRRECRWLSVEAQEKRNVEIMRLHNLNLNFTIIAYRIGEISPSWVRKIIAASGGKIGIEKTDSTQR